MPRPPSPKAWPCVVLAIDSAQVSGWALFVSGELITAGVCKVDHDAVVSIAQAQATAHKLPLIVVAETWSPGFKSHKTVLGMGAAWGIWTSALTRAKHPKRRIVKVLPATWRSAVLHRGRRGRDLWKAAAQSYVKQRYHVELSDDAAEAVCIGVWGMHAGEVGALIPKRGGKQ